MIAYLDVLPVAFAFLVGAVFGSFLNVCVARWPKEQSVVRPPSRCPHCDRPIRWYENVPLASWLALRGRCRGCARAISIMYPLVELTVAIGWAAAVAAFGPTLTALRVAVFGTILFGVVLTDALHYVIPDGFTAFGLVVGLIGATVAAFTHAASPFAGLYDALIGACVGAGAIAISGWLGEMAFKKEAMGFGDVTLMAMIGAHIGPGRTLLTVFLGALIGAIVFLAAVYPIGWLRSRKRGEEFSLPLVPFGVFLAPAGLVALLWGQRVIDWYLHGVMGL
ncbi:MAG TPA: prepilin peptidase [Gemmatimonadaceae bacterium]|nr:prepilin peptidase [Gemmatimonadaceae bacterium]